MKLRDRRSILGIDPTKRGLAFVLIEHGELIDWGSRSCGLELKDWLALLDKLANGFAADVLVVEDPDAQGCVRRARVRQYLRAGIAQLRNRGVDVATVSRRRVRDMWKALGKRTKQAVAERIAEDFPELGPFVPPPRKVFMDEDARLQVFDALTLVLAASDPSFPVGR